MFLVRFIFLFFLQNYLRLFAVSSAVFSTVLPYCNSVKSITILPKVFLPRSLSALFLAAYSAFPIFQELRFGSEVVSPVLYRPSCLESLLSLRFRCFSDNVSSVLSITLITALL